MGWGWNRVHTGGGGIGCILVRVHTGVGRIGCILVRVHTGGGGIGCILVRVVRVVRLAETQRKEGRTHRQTDILFHYYIRYV